METVRHGRFACRIRGLPGKDAGWRAIFSPSRIFNPKAFQSGGGGMAGTADDLLKLLEALRTGGEPILKSETVRAGLSNQIGDIEGGARCAVRLLWGGNHGFARGRNRAAARCCAVGRGLRQHLVHRPGRGPDRRQHDEHGA